MCVYAFVLYTRKPSPEARGGGTRARLQYGGSGLSSREGARGTVARAIDRTARARGTRCRCRRRRRGDGRSVRGTGKSVGARARAVDTRDRRPLQPCPLAAVIAHRPRFYCCARARDVCVCGARVQCFCCCYCCIIFFIRIFFFIHFSRETFSLVRRSRTL